VRRHEPDGSECPILVDSTRSSVRDLTTAPSHPAVTTSHPGLKPDRLGLIRLGC
jgi:hypothetical protein